MKNIFTALALLSSTTLFAQNGGGAREGNFVSTLVMLGIAVLFFYFILWRPEKKRRKALEEKRSSVKKGDKVTAMGLVGTVDKVKDTTLILKMVEGAKVEILKMAVTEVEPTTTVEETKDSGE